MKLTAEAVNKIFKDCLFKEGESTEGAIKVEGVVNNFGFNSERLEGHKQEIVDLLLELPDTFREKGGGGWSFLQACVDKNDSQWGEHPSMEKLMCLGLAIKKVEYLMPREMWPILPGGVPYFVIKGE